MRTTNWIFLSMILGIVTGIGYDVLGPESKTVLALGLSTGLSAVMIFFSLVV